MSDVVWRAEVIEEPGQLPGWRAIRVSIAGIEVGVIGCPPEDVEPMVAHLNAFRPPRLSDLLSNVSGPVTTEAT